MSTSLKVIPDSSARPWYADDLQFSCTCCGNCCTGGPGYVWISDEEIGRLARHLGLGVDQTIARYCRRVGDRYSLNENRNERGEYDCVFLKELPPELGDGQTVNHPRRVCGIYHVRPLQCRTWPFWHGLLGSPDDWRRASRRCPGIDRGRKYSQEEIERLRDAENWPEEGR